MNDIYKIIIAKSAQKEIQKLQKPELPRILTAIKSLSSDPRPSGCKKLVGSQNTFRIRIGDYRVLYAIEDQIRIVEIAAVKHRREAYE
ncbi:type II toxin-antitoxin system RelE/ParE family toxin [Dyadobacter sp. CY326]|uniref:type II toxin-antitoxin system RelE family toxin n=1 Tax=Dyadobacter sp. CY326 TaxID=2907300 RepID=UPI001F233F4C|nr:type II toxin-antitoxin system RelE/ParE family toxin [Dyadobacter sp. CY326]MCE7068378.1 type II toxin-antitoxin system RelE/ParE family toxin [Dyadobacter sp. CY326]